MSGVAAESASCQKIRLPRLAWWLVLSWFGICALGSLGSILRSSLEPSLGGRLIVGLIFGFYYGTIFYCVFVFPLQIVLAAIAACISKSPRVLRTLFLAPAWIAIAIVICHAASLQMLVSQRFWFTKMTGRVWPDRAQLVMVRHGLGMQDKRHLWVFEGNSEQFEAMLHDGGWVSSDEYSAEWKRQPKMCLSSLSDHYHGNAWAIAATYIWLSDDDENPGPMGPGWLFVDSTRTRWCVWWDAI